MQGLRGRLMRIFVKFALPETLYWKKGSRAPNISQRGSQTEECHLFAGAPLLERRFLIPEG
jgi:hypothetical protein